MERDFRQVAQSWLDGNYDEETKAQVRELMKDPAALEDAFYRNLEFGTGGLRGVMGVGTNRMNKYVVAMATQGLANYILKNVKSDNLSVCVSFDSRNNSDVFAKITAEVLSANGIHVYIYDCLHPVPLLSYAVRKKHATAGVMVTASHNPKEYNGYKVYWSDGAQIIAPVDKDIVAEVNAISDPSMVKYKADGKEGGIETMGDEMNNAYMDDVLTLMLSPEARARHADLKIVYTPLHGSGVHIVPAILKRLGFENIYHVPEQDVSDGNFPATDPDADRLGIAVRDNDGKMVLFNGNQTASMLTYYILRRWSELGKLDGTKYVVKTIVTTDSRDSSISPISYAAMKARASSSAGERKATAST